MLIPKKQKYRKHFRGRSSLKGVASKGHTLTFGEFGLKALESAEITSRQIEAARKVIVKHTKRIGKIWIRIFPHKPITRKSAEVPMGSGKGAVEFYVATVLKGKILFEISGVDVETAKHALKLCAFKLPIKCKVIENIYG